MADDKIILTPVEAEGVLPDGDYVHSYANPSAGLFVGIDNERDGAIEIIRKALQLEIGGENCKHMKHGLVVWVSERRPLFFATDPDRLAELEASKMALPSTESRDP